MGPLLRPIVDTEYDKLQKQSAASSTYASVELRSNACTVSFSMTRTSDNKIVLQSKNSRFMSITSPIEAKTKQQMVAKLYGEEFALLLWIQRLIIGKPIETTSKALPPVLLVK